MASIGGMLRSERLRRGLRLEQVFAETKIGLHFLVAMEEERFDCLPGGLLTRSFLRQYAHALGLNEDEIIAILKQQFEEPANPLPEPEPERRSMHVPHLPELVWILAAASACAGVYGLWHKAQGTSPAIQLGTGLRRPEPQLPQRLTPKSTPAPALLPKPSDPEARSAVVSGRELMSLVTGAEGAAPSEPVSGSSWAVRVDLTATEPVWVSIRSDRTLAYCGTLDEQDRKEFHASDIITILAGNAGGLKISLNGRPVGPIGAHGEVQLVALTPNAAYVVPRTSPTAPSVSKASTGSEE